MKRYIYNRVSSAAQDYLQQEECIRQYFERQGIDASAIAETVVETVSGTVNYEERKLSELIDRCEPGDIIYVSELSRLSRSMADLFALVNKCCNKGKEEAEKCLKRGEEARYGITIIQCKDGAVIENNSIAGKAILFAIGLAAEIEVNNIRQRTKMALAARMEEARKNGFWISKTGHVCTRIGSEKGCDTSVMREAAYEDRHRRKKEFLENSAGFKFVKRKLIEGWRPKDIIKELEILDAECPGMYRSRTGGKITQVTITKWKDEIFPQKVVNVVSNEMLGQLPGY